MIWFLIFSIIIIMFLGFPIKIALLLGPLLTLLIFMPDIDPMFLVQQVGGGIEMFVLLAIPMFIFAADIMTYGQTATRLLDLVESFIGHIKGGLGITVAAACTAFGTVSGSTQATVVAIGKPMEQRMRKANFKDKDIYPLIASAANISLLIPPSVVMIMYAVMSGISVGNLFITCVGPGIMLFFAFAAWEYYKGRRYNLPTIDKKTWAERLVACRRAILPMGFPIIILGGIYSGILSPTEAAAASVLYAFVLEVLVFKKVKIQNIPSIALSSAIVTSVVLILVAAGMGLSWEISLAKLPQVITDTLIGSNPSALWVMFIVTILYFIACMMIDQFVVITVLAPIFAVPALAAGIDPMHLGVVVMIQCALGSITPPLGCNVFAACAAFNKNYATVTKGMLPYITIFLIFTALFIFFPDLALVTYNLFGS